MPKPLTPTNEQFTRLTSSLCVFFELGDAVIVSDNVALQEAGAIGALLRY
jgi:hypothetical protein